MDVYAHGSGDSASCHSTSSVSVTNYVIIIQNEIKNKVYNIATKIVPFFTYSNVVLLRERQPVIALVLSMWENGKISSLCCVNQSETSHQGPTATSATVEMVPVRVGKRSDGQRQKVDWYGVSLWYTPGLNHVLDECNSRPSKWDNNSIRSIAAVLAPITFNIIGYSVQQLCRTALFDNKEYSWQFWFVSPGY